MLVLAIEDLRMLLKAADITAAMSVEGQLATDRVFAADLQALRPHPGQAASRREPRPAARRLRRSSPATAGPDCNRVQDAYSLRCSPQVHGAARDTVDHAALVAVARAGLARSTTRWCSTTAGWSPTATSTGRRSPTCSTSWRSSPPTWRRSAERRTDRFLDRARSHGLPPFLAHDPGVDSGHMIAQYTQAAIVSELKRLANPASVDSIPSSAMQEDHVSMGWSAARKLRRSVDGLARVVAIEYLTAARALDLRAPARARRRPPPRRSRCCAATSRDPGPDRHLAPEIEHAFDDVRSGALVRAVEDTMGELA